MIKQVEFISSGERNVPQDFDLTKRVCRAKTYKQLDIFKGLSWLADKNRRVPETWSRVAKCNKRVKYSGQKVRTKILKTKHFTVQFKRGQNTHTKQTCINFLTHFQSTKTSYNLQFQSFGNAALNGLVFQPRFFTANFRGGKFKQNREKVVTFDIKTQLKFRTKLTLIID